jgi:hypothetical protein
VVRRDGLRTVSRTLFALQERNAERSTAWKEGREALPKGRFVYGSRCWRGLTANGRATCFFKGVVLSFGQWSRCSG